MKKLQLTKEIHANREKVWNVLWDDASYRAWTSVFSEGSYAKTDWKEGGKVLFLSADGGGMYSQIEKKNENEFMSFKHLGVVKNGVEQPLDDETRKWSGAMENYRLKQNGDNTTLTVEMDITEEFEEYFKEKFPKALDKVKELAES